MAKARKPPLQVSEAEIDAHKTAAGGWTKASLAQWGVKWPPPRGWRQALINGTPIPKTPRKTGKPAWLRRKKSTGEQA